VDNKTNDRRTHAKRIDAEFEKKISKYNISAKKILPIVVISVIVDMMGYMIVMPLLPFYAQQFGASDFTIGIVVALNAITSLISGPIWGRLSDKYGRKPILLIAQAGTLFAFGILAVANSIELLMLSRIVDGIFGGQIPVINAAITDVSAPETRSEKMSVMAVSVTVGTIVGPTIGGYLGDINLAYPAYAACLMAISSILATIFIFNETMPKQRREDLKEWIKLERHGENKLRFTHQLMVRLAQVFTTVTMFSMTFSSLSLILNQRYSVTSFSIGNVMAVMGVCTFIFGGILMRHVKYSIGEQRLLLLGICLFTVGYVVMPMLPTFTSFLLFIVIFSAGNNFARPVVTSNLSRAVDPDKQGTVSGYSTTMESLARTVAPLMATGWLQLGGIHIGGFAINEFYMIGITGILIGLGFLALYFVDQKKYFKGKEYSTL
jgi:MFS family permease